MNVEKMLTERFKGSLKVRHTGDELSYTIENKQYSVSVFNVQEQYFVITTFGELPESKYEKITKLADELDSKLNC